jgi:plastocyanin domain-containing protein
VIEFTPEKTGRFSYSCWMGMIRGSITVVEKGRNAADTGKSINPAPAGVSIPTDKIALAAIQTGGTVGFRHQEISVNLRDDGIDPAVIVVQRGVPAIWTINNNSLDPGDSRLIFPAYYARLELKQGSNVMQLMPTGDFDFSTMDNVFYGFVKVVDDLSRVDIEAVKAEVSEFETLIYPEAYFEQADVQ